MTMMTSYKFRIYPTKEQSTKIEETFRSVKFIWNKNVEIFNSYKKGEKLNYKSTTILRQEFEFLQISSYCALQQMERNFQNTLKQFFNKKRKKRIGRPQFKKEQNSYQLTNKKYNIRGNKIYLEKIGLVKIEIDRIIPTNVKYYSCTVSKSKSGKYFVSIAFSQDEQIFEKTNKAVGIDLGLKTLVVASNGKEFETKKYYRKSQNRLKKLQKHLSRKVKGSNRFNKNRIKLARTHEKVANQRKHNNHLISHELTRDFDFISIENLNIEGMKKNKKLSKSISDAGWSQLVSFLEYKAKNRGKTLQRIDRWFPSSKMCRICGAIKEDERKIKRGEMKRRWLNTIKWRYFNPSRFASLCKLLGSRSNNGLVFAQNFKIDL
jgi:putative transposase